MFFFCVWLTKESIKFTHAVLYAKSFPVDLSIAVPITNSLTVIITTLTGKLLGEGNINAGI